MPLKKPTPKTPQQIEELIELLVWRLNTIKCKCRKCAIGRALVENKIDALLWALGKEPNAFIRAAENLKRNRVDKTKHQCSHSE